jgi:long-chain-fatty-acid--CoA ligase ACSBG
VVTLQWAKPTLFLAVPRVWEKMEEKMKDIAASNGSILQSIAGWAKGLGAA